jgi:uncharacterized protein YecT (DUF1311 family)
MNACFAAIARAAEKERARAYAALEATLEGARRRQLAAAEKAWAAYRDAECAFEADRYEGGSLAPTIHGSCVAELTQQRTKLLEGLRQQEDL